MSDDAKKKENITTIDDETLSELAAGTMQFAGYSRMCSCGRGPVFMNGMCRQCYEAVHGNKAL